MKKVIIGTVGFYFGLSEYPLGSVLYEQLQQARWPEGVTLRDMNIPPVVVMQDIQSRNEDIDRMVLVAGIFRGLEPCTITCRHWQGGTRSSDEMQERMFQGLVGGLNLDNLLIIGEYFKIWPPELITVEVEISNNLFGAMAIAHGRRAARAVAGEQAQVARQPAPEVSRLIHHVFELTQIAASSRIEEIKELKPFAAEQITPLPHWIENEVKNVVAEENDLSLD
jgi:hypothetical protein